MKTLPTMTDCNGCGGCCGPVAATEAEMTAIREYTQRWGVSWAGHADLATCGFYDAAARRCRIYPVRPFLCRAYGVTKELACPFFPQAARQSLPPREIIKRGLAHPLNRLLAEEFAPDHGAAHLMIRAAL